jgi:hypothetical protein
MRLLSLFCFGCSGGLNAACVVLNYRLGMPLSWGLWLELLLDLVLMPVVISEVFDWAEEETTETSWTEEQQAAGDSIVV